MDFQYPAMGLTFDNPHEDMGIVKRVGKKDEKTTGFRDWLRIFSVQPFSSLRDEVVCKLRSEKALVR